VRSRLFLTEKGIEVVARFTCPARRISDTLHFLIDTGSERSFLGWETAVKVGLVVEDLPRYPKPVFGFGGAAEAKHLSDLCALHVPFEGDQLETVEIRDGILVYRPSRTQTKHWKAGPSVSIIGRDVLTLSGWKLVVDLSQDQMYFEKS